MFMIAELTYLYKGFLESTLVNRFRQLHLASCEKGGSRGERGSQVQACSGRFEFVAADWTFSGF